MMEVIDIVRNQEERIRKITEYLEIQNDINDRVLESINNLKSAVNLILISLDYQFHNPEAKLTREEWDMFLNRVAELIT